MARSLKKGFYVNPKLLKKIKQMNESGERRVLKIYDRATQIIPDMV